MMLYNYTNISTIIRKFPLYSTLRNYRIASNDNTLTPTYTLYSGCLEYKILQLASFRMITNERLANKRACFAYNSQQLETQSCLQLVQCLICKQLTICIQKLIYGTGSLTAKVSQSGLFLRHNSKIILRNRIYVTILIIIQNIIGQFVNI